MNEEFEVLDSRPTLSVGRGRGPSPDPLCVAVEATAGSGGAVRFTVNRTTGNTMRVRLSTHMRRRNLRARVRKQLDGSFIAWAEPRVGNK